MDYFQAQKIRKTSLSDLIADQIASGGGVTSSIGKGISAKSRAATTGIKQKFDPLNIAKFVTGGSNIAPAILGRLTGRSSKDIKFFTGKKQYDTASKIKPLEEGDGLNDILGKIISLMQGINEAEKARRDQANQFAEENALERARRHKELIEAITGKPYTGDPKKPTATKVADTAQSSFLDDILDAFGLGRTALSILKTVGKIGLFFTGPVGLAILGAGSIAAFGYFLYKALKAEPSYEAEQEAKGIKQAESVGGLAGVMDERDRRKKMPEYDRTMAELKDFETFQNEGEKLTNKQLEPFGKRGPGALEAVEDYKVARDEYKRIVGEPLESATPIPSPAPATPSATPTSSAVEAPVAAPVATQKLSQVQNENLDLSIPESNPDPTTVINNNSVKSYETSGNKIPMPAVRNLEPTFQNMILYSTRVV
jgi:hypothetical protein